MEIQVAGVANMHLIFLDHCDDGLHLPRFVSEWLEPFESAVAQSFTSIDTLYNMLVNIVCK
jgi:hypothetical protein